MKRFRLVILAAVFAVAMVASSLVAPTATDAAPHWDWCGNYEGVGRYCTNTEGWCWYYGSDVSCGDWD